MPSGRYIEHYQRRRDARFIFRSESLTERVGRFLVETGEGQAIRPQRALVKALRDNDVDAAVHIALRLLPSTVEPLNVWERPVTLSGEIDTKRNAPA